MVWGGTPGSYPPPPPRSLPLWWWRASQRHLVYATSMFGEDIAHAHSCWPPAGPPPRHRGGTQGWVGPASCSPLSFPAPPAWRDCAGLPHAGSHSLLAREVQPLLMPEALRNTRMPTPLISCSPPAVGFDESEHLEGWREAAGLQRPHHPSHALGHPVLIMLHALQLLEHAVHAVLDA